MGFPSTTHVPAFSASRRTSCSVYQRMLRLSPTDGRTMPPTSDPALKGASQFFPGIPQTPVSGPKAGSVVKMKATRALTDI